MALLAIPSSSPAFRALLAAMVLALSLKSSRGEAFSGWKQGRATYYDGPTDYWSIHEGSCGYGYLDKDTVTGWDIAALSDQFESFGGSCGRCYEVKCDPTRIRDNYGAQFDRHNVCHDASESVVVQVTDSCPCWYPGNQWSNKRWCCGDMAHMDLSAWAMGKLADLKWGVIGMQYRRVSCNHQPNKKAYDRRSPPRDNGRFTRPIGWKDRRPNTWF